MRKPISLLLLALPLAAQPLPGTASLTSDEDLAMEMVASIDRYLMRRLAESPSRRPRPDAASRDRLRKVIGVVDRLAPGVGFVTQSLVGTSPTVAVGAAWDAMAVRWPVLDGIEGEGLLLRPKNGAPKAAIIAVPDAGWIPEQLVGLVAGIPREQQFARRLADSGCLVLVPYLIDRADTMSGNPRLRFTNQPHREFIHRMAYEMGRHIIGYEVQKLIAGARNLKSMAPDARLGVFGYGEGGMLALFASAVDDGFHAAAVSGYFQPRENVVWSEPIYRNVWSQLETWGDAELAGLVAPRPLLIEAAPHPQVSGPPPERDGRRGAASGKIVTPSMDAVRSEVDRARKFHPVIQFAEGGPGGDPALLGLLNALGVSSGLAGDSGNFRLAFTPNAAARAERQFRQMIDFTQRLMHLSEFARRDFMAKFDPVAQEPYRKLFWEESQGRMPAATEPLSGTRSRRYIDTPKFTGYEVTIPVWGDIDAYGILLLPKDLKPGERRPVVVCQHGLEGRPQFLVDPKDQRNIDIYARFAAALAERGFIVFAPQNPYIGTETFRVLMRKANPVKLSLFSFIIGQHSRIIDWLETQPWVDKARIGFYGLSYGGKTAMRVPAVETRYALSICSGDFNEWVWKVVSTDFPFSYMFTQEYDMLEFDLGHTFNYAEQAMLIAPRPFMVERGHKDGVGIDEWVSLEYAKVRRHYVNLGIADKTMIEYFNGPHQIHGVGTYDFLHRHLNWPKPQ